MASAESVASVRSNAEMPAGSFPWSEDTQSSSGPGAAPRYAPTLLSVSPRPARAAGASVEGGVTRRSFVQSLALRGEDEIALGEPVDLVGPDADRRSPPGEKQVGVMILRFGQVAYPVHER